LRHRILTFATIASVAAGVSLFVAPSASASGYGCSGSQIDTYNVNHGSTLFGVVHLYYNSSTGKNCAVTVKTAAGGYGTKSQIDVVIDRCATPGSHPGYDCYSLAKVDDSGNYAEYAGPVSLSAAGSCIAVYGYVSTPNYVSADVQTGPVHCK